MDERQELLNAAAQIKAGDRAGAVTTLTAIVRTNPQSEQGWLLLGHTIVDQERKKQCFQKVLEINPRNERAQEFLFSAYEEVREEKKTAEETLRQEEKSRKFMTGSLRTSIRSRPMLVRGAILGILLAVLYITARAFLPVIFSPRVDPQPVTAPVEATSTDTNLGLPPTWTPTPNVEPSATPEAYQIPINELGLGRLPDVS